jgi:broad specificity phosphatase PhoE
MEPLLIEWDYGDYEGVTSAQIHQQRPDWDLWRDGCPHGESVDQVQERARAFLNRAMTGDGPVIAFSHGHFLRTLTLVFLGFPSEAGARFSLDTAAVSVLRRTEQGRLLQLWNDTGHLPGLPA